MIRSWKNSIVPINRIPPEILALLPDYFDTYNYYEAYDDRDGDVIALTHVCRAWRVIFTTRPSLWTNLNCVDMHKTLVYLERSKPLSIKMSLHGENARLSHRPFFKIIPHAIERLKFLSVDPEHLREITPHLSHPAPLLEDLFIACIGETPRYNPMVASTLFNGDLTSLHTLQLECVTSELPWRNMINLTELTMVDVIQTSAKVFLDFFESAPHLREVELHSDSPTHGTQDERLVSLGSLTRMSIDGGRPSLLLDHLLIPVGADLEVEMDLPSPPRKNHAPRFLDNLSNLQNFTEIRLDNGFYQMTFSGPNGEVRMAPATSLSLVDGTRLMVDIFALLDTSKTEQLRVNDYKCSPSIPPHRLLLPMKRLRTIELYRCENPDAFVHVLDPSMSSSGATICPELEELIVYVGETLDIEKVIGMVAARALRGVKLKLVRISNQDKFDEVDVLELKKYVSHVEC